MPVALSLEGSFGFAVQTAKGTYASPTTWLPLMEQSGRPGETVSLRKNYVLLDAADGKAYQTSYYSGGEWAEGQLHFPLVPGSVSALFSWVQHRDSENQGKWASVIVDCINEVKKLTDVKVRRAVLNLVKGEPVTCTLDVCGLLLESGSTPTPTFPAAAPYLYREATVELATGGGTVSDDANCEAIRLEINNAVEDPTEGLRLSESHGPVQLYNLAGVRCSGSLSRDFVDNAVYSDFAGGEESALLITLERGATVASISLPRLLHTGTDLGLPGSHAQRIVEQVDFVALGSANGATPPVVLA